LTLTPSCLGMGCYRIKPVADLEQFTPFLLFAARLRLSLGHLTGLEVDETSDACQPAEFGSHSSGRGRKFNSRFAFSFEAPRRRVA